MSLALAQGAPEPLQPGARPVDSRTKWSPENTDILRALWLTHSATEIGAKLGCSRSAVIGRAHRLELPAKRDIAADTAVKEPKKPKMRIRRAYLYEPEPLPRQDIEAPEPLNVALVALEERHCRYITGMDEQGLSLSCGHARRTKIAKDGKRVFHGAYCLYHACICLQ